MVRKIAFVAVLIALVSADLLAGRPDDAKQRIGASGDVAWLEGVAASPAEARKLVPEYYFDEAKDLRTLAYARLSAIGTRESLAAVQRIEAKAREVIPAPATVPLDIWTHPCWHFGDKKVKLMASAVTADGTTYGIVNSTILGDECDIFLVSSRTPDDLSSWSRPRLIPHRLYRGVKDPALAAAGDRSLRLTYVQEEPPGRPIMSGTLAPGEEAPTLGPQEVTLSVADIERDTDGDGWTDVEEGRLGLDPQKADSDGDGLPDGKDICPNYAPEEGDTTDEEAQVIAKAFFATFGLSDSRHIVLMEEGTRPVQLWGYAGPVLYGDVVRKWRWTHDYGGVFLKWKATIDGDTARVDFSDWEGGAAGSGQFVELRKIDGTWSVTNWQTTWIS